MSEQVTVQQALDASIRQRPVEPGDYLVGWIVIAEWLHSDGERSLASVNSEGMTPWQRTGYLTDVLDQEE